MNAEDSNKLLSTLAWLELECVVGTEDGKFSVYYDPFEQDYLFAGRWVDIWYEEDHPLPPPESRQICKRGKNLDEISAGFKDLYNEQIWSHCRIEYLKGSSEFTNLLFAEWEKLGLQSLSQIDFVDFGNTVKVIQKAYEKHLSGN